MTSDDLKAWADKVSANLNGGKLSFAVDEGRYLETDDGFVRFSLVFAREGEEPKRVFQMWPKSDIARVPVGFVQAALSDLLARCMCDGWDHFDRKAAE